jgi:hypothetical protein
MESIKSELVKARSVDAVPPATAAAPTTRPIQQTIRLASIDSDIEQMPSPTLVKFGWTTLDEELFPNLSIPYLERASDLEADGRHVRYVCVRITEKAVLSNFVELSPESRALPPLTSVMCTEAECAQLNEINKNHVDLAYGPDEFLPNAEILVRLDKFKEFFDVLKKTAALKNQPQQTIFPAANINLPPSNLHQQQQHVQIQQARTTHTPPTNSYPVQISVSSLNSK